MNEPVFAVNYGGYTHATVPGFASIGMLSFLLAPMAAAWLLSRASERVEGTYLNRVFFIASLGVFIAIAGDLMRSLTEEASMAIVAGKVAITIIVWILTGLVLAWRIRPASSAP